jgi:hypothetical protein
VVPDAHLVRQRREAAARLRRDTQTGDAHRHPFTLMHGIVDTKLAIASGRGFLDLTQ